MARRKKGGRPQKSEIKKAISKVRRMGYKVTRKDGRGKSRNTRYFRKQSKGIYVYELKPRKD